MVGRCVEGVEAMIFVLNLRAVGHGETNLAEGADDIVGYLGKGMEFADGAAASGQREISGFFGQRGNEFEFLAANREGGFELYFRGVNGLARGRFFFLRQRSELFHKRGEFAVGADPRAFGLLERGNIGRAFQLGERRLLEWFDFSNERHRESFAVWPGGFKFSVSELEPCERLKENRKFQLANRLWGFKRTLDKNFKI
jgi:hypothetical protein